MLKNLNLSTYNDASEELSIFFPDGFTPQVEGLEELHNNIMFYLAIISFAVSWITISIILHYKKPKISKDDLVVFLFAILYFGYIYLLISRQVYAMSPEPEKDIIILETSERANIPGVVEVIKEYKSAVKTSRDLIMDKLRTERAKGYTFEDELYARRMRFLDYPDYEDSCLKTAFEDRLTLCRQQCYEQIDLMKHEKYEEALQKLKNLKPEMEAPYYGFTGRPFEKDGLDIISQVNLHLFHTGTETITTVDPRERIDLGYNPNAPEGRYQPYGSMLAKKFENDIIYPHGIHGWKEFPDLDKKSTSFLTGFINHHNPNIWKIGSNDASLTDPEFLAKLKRA